MLQFSNSNRVMESGNHLKNEARLKSWTSRGNVYYLIICAMLLCTLLLNTSCIATLTSTAPSKMGLPYYIKGNINDSVFIFKNNHLKYVGKLPYRMINGGKEIDTIRVYTEKYSNDSILVQKNLNPLVFTNILFGPLGLWGWFVDKNSDVIWKPKQKEYFIDLKPVNRTNEENFNLWYIIGEKCINDRKYANSMLCFQKAYKFKDITNIELSNAWNAIGEFCLSKEVKRPNDYWQQGLIEKEILPFFQRAYEINSANEMSSKNITIIRNKLAYFEKQKQKKAEQKEQELAVQRKQQANDETMYNTLTELKTVLQNASNTMDNKSNSTSTNSSGSNSQNNSNEKHALSYQIKYDAEETNAKSTYNALMVLKQTNTGEAIDGVPSKVTTEGVDFVYQKKLLRQIQDRMKKIRAEATQKGITIKKSLLEDVTVNY